MIIEEAFVVPLISLSTQMKREFPLHLSRFQVNLLFLINIVRIVVTKVQHQMNTNQTETAHIKKAVRATVILFPLLGITNFLFFFKPEGGIYEKLYLFFNAILKSSQVMNLAYFKLIFRTVWASFTIRNPQRISRT